MKKKTFRELVDMSANWTRDNEEFDCDVVLSVDGIDYKAYSVSIAKNDLLFYTKHGTITYLIDHYGDRNVASLYEVDME